MDKEKAWRQLDRLRSERFNASHPNDRRQQESERLKNYRERLWAL